MVEGVYGGLGAGNRWQRDWIEDGCGVVYVEEKDHGLQLSGGVGGEKSK